MTEPTNPTTLTDRFWRLPWDVRVGLVVVLGLAALAVVGQARIAGNNSPTRTAVAQAPQATTAQAGPAGQVGEGVWLVGSQVQPGVYRSAGAVNDRYCMWSRHDTASGGAMDGIIASDGSYGGQKVVTIEAGDVLFRTAGCAPFVKIS